MTPTHTSNSRLVPQLTNGFMANLRPNLTSGFLVFLIAMPICLAIARASNFPPIAGIWTAVLGGLVCSFLSDSQLTIKGPAAGLIVIVAGAVTELGEQFGTGLDDHAKALLGYHLALGIGVTVGLVQMAFGLLKAGRLGEWFPLTPVHGMLASIGIIIISKQLYVVVGADAPPGAEPLELLAHFPRALLSLNPEIAIIGVVSLILLFGLPLVRQRFVSRIPTQLVVLVVGVALGHVFDLEHEHKYLFPDSFFADSSKWPAFDVGPRFLVDMPNVLSDPASAFALPDFRGVLTPLGLKYLVLFSLIGSLESLLSAKAIDLLDPWKRKTNLNRDLFAVGLANTLSGALGGLPMISEIVRSSANITNGGRTRDANFFHGAFLLVFVLLAPNLIHSIPLAALGAMLVYTGTRLASPREIVNTYRIGREQLIVFVGTIVATLATDLLIGIASGIAIKILLHVLQGVRPGWLVKSQVEQKFDDGETVVLVVGRAAVFTNWLSLGSAINCVSSDRAVVVDLSATHFVDHSVMEKLFELMHDLADRGRRLTIVGLDNHRPLSRHPQAARRRVRQLVPVASESTPLFSQGDDRSDLTSQSDDLSR